MTRFLRETLLFALFAVCQTYDGCGAPPTYPDKHLHRKFLHKGRVHYTCGRGLTGLGSGVSTCQDGRWTPLKMLCREKCHAPPDIENGRYEREGDKAFAVCDEGFVLRGERVRVCDVNSWNGSSPTCHSEKRRTRSVALAGHLVENMKKKGGCGPAPSHDLARPRGPALLTQTHFLRGARVRYRCEAGFRWAGGGVSVVCQSDGWTPLQIQCERKKCGSAGDFPNGRFQYSGAMFGDSATAVCQDGYELIGPSVRVCRDGGWDARVPVCEPVHCPAPPEVTGGAMEEDTPHDVPYGHVVTYYCRSGSLIGPREIHCTRQGTWSSAPPECREVTCPRPRLSRGARMMGFRSVYQPGDGVVVRCGPGRRLRGESHVSCGTHGLWIPKLPQCV